jgi:hypothetical protein
LWGEERLLPVEIEELPENFSGQLFFDSEPDNILAPGYVSLL